MEAAALRQPADATMEDAGKVEHTLGASLNPPSIGTLDGWIESLMTCKQLAESDVQRLCDKVWTFPRPLAECSMKRSLAHLSRV